VKYIISRGANYKALLDFFIDKGLHTSKKLNKGGIANRSLAKSIQYKAPAPCAEEIPAQIQHFVLCVEKTPAQFPTFLAPL